MSLISQLMRPEDFVKLDQATAARLEAVASQVAVTDQNRAALQKQIGELHKMIPR